MSDYLSKTRELTRDSVVGQRRVVDVDGDTCTHEPRQPLPPSSCLKKKALTGVASLVRAGEGHRRGALRARAADNVQLRALHVELRPGVARRAVQGYHTPHTAHHTSHHTNPVSYGREIDEGGETQTHR